MGIRERVLLKVKEIREGEVKTYKEIAELAGNKRAWRLVARLMRENEDRQVPCHRVVRSDRLIGGYCGSFKNSWLKAALLLKEGAILVLPTDTIYGICTSAFKKEAVEKVYSLRKRSPEKPCIILIEKIADLSLFGIRLKKAQKEILNQLWPGKVSVVLKIFSAKKRKELHYLHRGTNSLAFRLPKSKFLRDILRVSGPLIAPSANFEGQEPAKTIFQAKKYFGKKVIYFDKGKLEGSPSTLIKLSNGRIEVLRKGSDWQKVKRLLK